MRVQVFLRGWCRKHEGRGPSVWKVWQKSATSLCAEGASNMKVQVSVWRVQAESGYRPLCVECASSMKVQVFLCGRCWQKDGTGPCVEGTGKLLFYDRKSIAACQSPLAACRLPAAARVPCHNFILVSSYNFILVSSYSS